MSGRRIRTVLLVSAFDAPAIDEDAGILAERYRVVRSSGAGASALARAISLARGADLVFSWFLSVYGAAAMLSGSAAGARSVAVVGGVDAARDAVTRYGLWLSPWKSALARRALRRADLVLPVAEPLRRDLVRLAGYDGRNIRVLPTGYDSAFWSPPGGTAGARQGVLTVAAASDRARFAVKGIDLLIEAARLLPDIPFRLIGTAAGLVAACDPPPNLEALPPRPRGELLEEYRRARVYCQPSRREGLPSALCEAMLCGCVPAAADAGGVSEAVGSAGFVAPPGDPRALAEAIRSALASPPSRGADARARIASLYPLERRRSDLLGLIETLGETGRPRR